MSGRTDQHYLVVPDHPDRAMGIEHPEACPQRGQLESVRTPEGYYACPFEEEAREHGLEASFDRYDNPIPLFLEAPIKVRPGRYPVRFGLHIASEQHETGEGEVWTQADSAAKWRAP